MSEEYIYFVQEEENNNIKIGVSVNPVQRLQELQTGNSNKLIMIGFIEGGADEENNIHREFAEERIRENGEWFRPSERLTNYIKQRIEKSVDYHLNRNGSSSSATNNYADGQRTITYDNGDKYEGEYKDGKRHGQGTYTFPDGKKYVGGWKDSKYHGQGTLTSSDGKYFVGEYKDSKPWNITGYDKNGNIKRKWVNGK